MQIHLLLCQQNENDVVMCNYSYEGPLQKKPMVYHSLPLNTIQYHSVTMGPFNYILVGLSGSLNLNTTEWYLNGIFL